MTIKKGIDWTGMYSRFSFETANGELKRYVTLLKETGKAVLDDDFNFLQDALLTYVRRLAFDTLNNGSPNNGFKIVGDSSNNDFIIKGGTGTLDGAGVFYVNGLRLILPADIRYSTQEVPGPALAPPGVGTRVDDVYLDVWIDEIDSTEDPTIVDPTLAVDTGSRAKLAYMVRVVPLGNTPANYIDANGVPHYTARLATINRTTSAQITPDMVVDQRLTILANGQMQEAIRDRVPAGSVMDFAGAAAPAGWLMCDGSLVSRSTYADLFAAIGVTYGAGDGATTFQLPDARGRATIGAGAGGTSTEFLAAAVNTGADTITVPSNDAEFITGKPVVYSTTGASIGGLVPGTTYYVIRVSAVAVSLAASLANAIAGVPVNLVSQGSGTHKLTYNLTARALGQKLGEESHTLTVAELALHGHPYRIGEGNSNTDPSGGIAMDNNGSQETKPAFTGVPTSDQDELIGGEGGNAPHNSMPPSLVLNKIIRT